MQAMVSYICFRASISRKFYYIWIPWMSSVPYQSERYITIRISSTLEILMNLIFGSIASIVCCYCISIETSVDFVAALQTLPHDPDSAAFA
jgi:hypothetical protein